MSEAMKNNEKKNAEELQPIKLQGTAFRSPVVTYFNYYAFYLFWLQKLFPEIEERLRVFLPRFSKLLGTSLANEDKFNQSRFYEELFSPPSWQGFARTTEILKLISQTDSKLKKCIDYEKRSLETARKLAKEALSDSTDKGLNINQLIGYTFDKIFEKDEELRKSLKYKDEIIDSFFSLRDDFFQWTKDPGLDKEWIRFYAVRALCKGQTNIKPSRQLIDNMLSNTDEQVKESINFSKTNPEENALIEKENKNLKLTESIYINPVFNYPGSFQFTESFTNVSNDEDYEKRAVEAYRRHIQNYIEKRKYILSKDYPSTRGNHPSFTDDVKILIAWNLGATVSQIEEVFSPSIKKDGINKVKQRCKEVNLPVRKDKSGRKREPVIFKEKITFLKEYKANNDEFSEWLNS